MKLTTLPSLTILGAALCLSSAQAAEPSASYPIVHTLTGNFKSTDGNSGTFVETDTVNSATSKTETTVFTRAKDNENRTATRTTTINPDGSRTVDFSATDYGASAAFTSHKTISKEDHGQFVGKGTFTNAQGVSGTINTLESKADTVSVVSAVYNSANGVTNDLRVEEHGFGFFVDKTLELDYTGKVTTTVYTRSVTGSK